MLTKIKLYDNSGVSLARVISNTLLYLGCQFTVSIQKTIAHSKIRKGNIQKGILINFKQNTLVNRVVSRKSMMLFKKAAKGNELIPIPTRLKSPLSSSIKNILGTTKVVSLAKSTI